MFAVLAHFYKSIWLAFHNMRARRFFCLCLLDRGAPLLSARSNQSGGLDRGSARLSTGRETPGRGDSSGFKVSMGHSPSWRPPSHLSPEQQAKARGAGAVDGSSGRKLTSAPRRGDKTGQVHPEDADDAAAPRELKKRGGIMAAVRKSLTRPGSAGSGASSSARGGANKAKSQGAGAPVSKQAGAVAL